MDDETHEVWRQGSLVELTATEFNLLRYMLENARRVLSKSEILDHVWTYDFDGDPNIVETYISYLRKKVDRVDPPLIHTIRGVGYSLRLPRDKDSGVRTPSPRDGPVSLRRRLVVGMLVLLVAALITTDVVTSSSLRSFLLGRLDEQIDASQTQAYNYISQVYERDLNGGGPDPGHRPRQVAGRAEHDRPPVTGASPPRRTAEPAV